MLENKTEVRIPLLMGGSDCFFKGISQKLISFVLFCITAIPTLAILFMIFYIAKEAFPFLANLDNLKEFFTSFEWRPSDVTNPKFGALSIFYGTIMVTIGSCVIAIPLSIAAAICLSEMIKKAAIFKSIIELLAAIPSVVYGFFAVVIMAKFLQNYGGASLSIAILLGGLLPAVLVGFCVGEILGEKYFVKLYKNASSLIGVILVICASVVVIYAAYRFYFINIQSGTNALNASIVLAVMALPTIVSLSQDALQSVGRDMREGSLALGATRAETIMKVVLPCAKSGIAAAVILGLMRVVGETMVVWMASGNSLKIPEPFYNFLEPVRTMTATIAGEMGEADQSTGAMRYHVLFAISFCLLIASLLLNAFGQYISSGFKFSRK